MSWWSIWLSRTQDFDVRSDEDIWQKHLRLVNRLLIKSCLPTCSLTSFFRSHLEKGKVVWQNFAWDKLYDYKIWIYRNANQEKLFSEYVHLSVFIIIINFEVRPPFLLCEIVWDKYKWGRVQNESGWM